MGPVQQYLIKCDPVEMGLNSIHGTPGQVTEAQCYEPAEDTQTNEG